MKVVDCSWSFERGAKEGEEKEEEGMDEKLRGDGAQIEELLVFTKERGSKGVWRDDVRWVRISVTFVWDGGELCNRITQGSEIYL